MNRVTAVLVTLFVGLSASLALGQTEEVGAHYEHLKDLDYFVGDWKIDGKLNTDFEGLEELTQGRLSLVFSYDWMKSKNFLTVAIRDKRRSPVQYFSVIGWDPVKRQIRSRDFNSEGAWFEYVHVKTENGWVVEGTSVYPGGTKGTFRGEVAIIDDDTFSYEGAGVMKHDGKDMDVSLTYKAKRRKPRDE